MVEGQDGTDTMAFNGSNANENMEVSANGGRVRFTRDVGNIVMDLNDVETIDAKALGGTDNLVVDDLSGTDVVSVDADLAAIGGGDDGQPTTSSSTPRTATTSRASPVADPTFRSRVSPPWSRCPAASPAATG